MQLVCARVIAVVRYFTVSRILSIVSIVFAVYCIFRVFSVVSVESHHMGSMLQIRFHEFLFEADSSETHQEQIGHIKNSFYKSLELGRKGFSLLESTLGLLCITSFLLLLNGWYLIRLRSANASLPIPNKAIKQMGDSTNVE